MLIRLLLALTLIPALEFYLLIRLAQATSAWMTFLLIIVSGVLGSMLLRREWSLAWQRFRHGMSIEGDLGEGRLPTEQLQDGLMIAFGGALLLTPGILTDALGFTLLFPLGRKFVRQHLLRRFFGGVQFQAFTHSSSAGQSTHTYWSTSSQPGRDAAAAPDVYASTTPASRIETIDAESVKRRD